MNTYTTFKKYPSATQAKEIEQLLLENGIECQLKNNASSLDGMMGGGLLTDYEVKILPKDFSKAEKLLKVMAAGWLSDVAPDYYLLTFTTDELRDIVFKQDEWSELDYLLARKLLEQRGMPISDREIELYKHERLIQLAMPEKVGNGWLAAGYITALLGGLFGVTTGYVVYNSKKTLPDGRRVYTYTEGDRAHARIMLFIGCVILISSILYMFVS